MPAFTDASGKFIPPMPRGNPKPNRLHLQPQETYFFKKSGGRFIAVDKDGAWRIFNGQNQIIGTKLTAIQREAWEYVGRTDGKKYVAAVNKAFEIMEKEGEAAYQAALEKALKAEYLLAKKDQTPPPNRDVINTSGMPDSQITG